MAKALLVCFRNRTDVDFSGFAKAVSCRIGPDNAVVNKSYIYQDGRLFAYIFNPPASIDCSKASFCVGMTRKTDVDKLKLAAPQPDGTFALFRSGEAQVELWSDYTASRTIWFHSTEDVFIASTSQRLIVAFLGGFVPNQKASSWMLATGTLGPGCSWDERLRHVPPNTRVVLDRAKWHLTVERGAPLWFVPTAGPRARHREMLETAVRESICELTGDSPSTLALSGGVDSRCVLYHLQDRKNLDTITWGVRGSKARRDSDATIAKTLADMCNLKHEYAATDVNVDLSIVLDRFLAAGEGRIDHLSGYMDGLRIWSGLSASGRNVIRGYDALGTKPEATDERVARRANGFALTRDYSHSFIPKGYEVSDEDIPSSLTRQTHETLNQWRDRLWLEFRTPFITAALDDIKAAYVEISNPLLFRTVVTSIQALPDALRTNKRLFREIVADMFPTVPFARSMAIQPLDDILNTSQVKASIRDELADAADSGLFSQTFLAFLAANLDERSGNRPIRKQLKALGHRYLPESLRSYIRKKRADRGFQMNVRREALRAIIIVRMNRILSEDAAAGRTALVRSAQCAR